MFDNDEAYVEKTKKKMVQDRLKRRNGSHKQALMFTA